MEKQPKLKLIVVPATLDAEKFSQYFSGAPILTIPGCTFPVTVFNTTEPLATDYLRTSLSVVMRIHLEEPPGICIFIQGAA
jgi:pre-mRNA-splicing factor ATP-dependent RNA helicase DHX15/PRP43